MKKVTSITLVLVLSAQCFYQLGVITYFHINNDYIAEVLCVNKEKPITMCHGQCFLDKSLDLADDAGDEGSLPAVKKIDFPVFLVCANSYSLTTFSLTNSGYPIYRSGISSEHIPGLFHPPTTLS